MKKKYLAIGLYSNLLGLEKGAADAGFQTILSTDIEDRAREAHRFLKADPVEVFITEDIHNLHFGDKKRDSNKDIQSLLSQSGLYINKGETALLMGGPPCFGMTTLSILRSVYNRNNFLMLQMLRLVDEIQPEVVLIEQVPPLLSHQMKPFFYLLVDAINKLENYEWSCKKLNAKNFGCNQSRERIIMILVRKDLGVKPSFPEPQPVDLSKQSAYNTIGAELIRTKERKGEDGKRRQRIIDGKTNLFPTLTSGNAEVFRGGKWEKITVADRKILAHMEHFDMSVVFNDGWVAERLGLMVLPPFAKALCEHIKTEILDKSIYSLKDKDEAA